MRAWLLATGASLCCVSIAAAILMGLSWDVNAIDELDDASDSKDTTALVVLLVLPLLVLCAVAASQGVRRRRLSAGPGSRTEIPTMQCGQTEVQVGGKV